MSAKWFLLVLAVFATVISAPGYGKDTNPAGSAPVIISGKVAYTGQYAADTLYVAVLDTTDWAAVGQVAVHATTAPFELSYAIHIDNLPPSRTLAIIAFLDVDGNSAVSNEDVVGWYAGQISPTFVSSDSSRAGLDFTLPRGEIRGTVYFLTGQTWANIMPLGMPGKWNPVTLQLPAHGDSAPYAAIGLYPGDWEVHAYGGDGQNTWSICAGACSEDECARLTLADGEVRSNVNLDFVSCDNVEPRSWSSVKTLYR